MKLSELIENPDNPSVASDEEIKRLKGKLERVPKGLTAMRIAYVTDKIDGKKMVISGNKRLRVLKQQYGEDADLPDEYFQDVTSMSEAERHEFIVTANISDGHWDAKKLLQQYDTSELNELIDSTTITKLISKTCINRARESGNSYSIALDSENAKSKENTVYKLGNHRLYVGDCTKQESYKKLLNGKIADMLLTDPPYSYNIANRCADQSKLLTIANDNLKGDEFKEFLKLFYKNAIDNLKPGGAYYIWHGDGSVEIYFHESILDVDVHQSIPLIWVKNVATFSMGRLHYNKQCEQCQYGWKNGAKCYFAGDTNSRTLIQDDAINIDNLTYEECKKYLKSIQSNVLRFKKPSKSSLHPTMKPVELYEKLISNSSKLNEIVLDPFLGSGTSIIACENLQRICYGMELLPYYADVIRKRWAEYVHGEGCDWEAYTPAILEEGIDTL